MTNPRVLAAVLILYLAVRLGLAALSYRGDPSPEARQRALRHFSAEQIDKGIEYSRAGFGISVAQLLAELALLLLFILSGGSQALGRVCLAWAGGRLWLQTLLYLAIFMLGSGLFDLPFAYFHDYMIERRFGFSNLTPSGWLLYQGKQAAVGGVLVLLVASGGYALLRAFPRGWVWLVPVGALVLQLVLTILFPRLILPLFYKIEPATDPKLIGAISRVAERGGVGVKKIWLINESQYSSHTNAFFTGFGRFKEIYLYDTLLKDHSPDEVGAILAHELGHWKRNHVLKGLILSEGGIVLACLALYYLFPLLAGAAWLRSGPLADLASLPLLMVIASIIGFFVSPISAGVSRRFEREADQIGMELTGSGAIFVRDFEQLAASNRSNLLPHPATVFWRYSHPPIMERIDAAERFKAAGQ